MLHRLVSGFQRTVQNKIRNEAQLRRGPRLFLERDWRYTSSDEEGKAVTWHTLTAQEHATLLFDTEQGDRLNPTI